MMPLLRQPHPADAPALAALATELGYPSDDADMARRLEHLASRPDQAVILAETPDGRVVGWIHVLGVHLLESEPFAEIGGLVVTEAMRGAGIGAVLVQAAERWARQAGFRRITVRSNVVRERAHRFYRRLDYACSKTQAVFSKAL